MFDWGTRLQQLESRYQKVLQYLREKKEEDKKMAATQQDLINVLTRLTEVITANTQQQAALMASVQFDQPVAHVNALIEQVQASTKALTDANAAALIPPTPAAD
jgi:hypothetical protein